MDTVQLAIVYETSTAEARLARLNRQLTTTQTSTKRMGLAAVALAQGLSTGTLSATALSSRLSTLGGRLGTIGIVVGLATGALALFKRASDKASEAALKFEKQLRETKRRVDDLLRVDQKSGFQREIEAITDAILELDRELAKQRLSLIERLFGGMSLGAFMERVKRFIFGGEDPATRRAREDQELQRQRAERGELSTPARRLIAESNRARTFAGLAGLSRMEEAAALVRITERSLEDMIVTFGDTSVEAALAGQNVREFASALRRVERASALMQRGLDTISDAIEDFVLTGTLAFTDFLNNILRLLYRDFSGGIVDSIMRTAFAAGTTPTIGATIPDIPPHVADTLQPSVATNVTFNVNAMDAQSVSTFFDQNGPRLAGIVAGQAKRSQGIRRSFQRT